MKKLEVLLLTGRSVWQGEGLESGKEGQKYKEACTKLDMNPADMAKLGLKDHDKVLLSSKYGEIVMEAVTAEQELLEGMAYVAYGTWVNVIVNPRTEGTGMPSFKGTKVTIEPTDKEIIENSLEVMEQAYL
jgi:formylmethanofuran dehydrogenase subunit D